MSTVRWLRVVAVLSVTVLLLVFSCSWQLSSRLPDGVPPPPGDPVPPINTYAEGRGADQLSDWAAERAERLDIPATALEAYAYAARVAEVENPNCRIRWTTLAGIGQVESRHGTYADARLESNGDVRPPIRGLRLDGTGGTQHIVDPDAGDLADDDGVVRALGPMQFIPETWRLYGVDANNDGIISPDNIDDAALTAAGYLCFRGKDLDTAEGWVAALRAYNHSEQYARIVRDWAAAYAAGHPL
ncbi:lytic murein transglycosylase [Mycobacterium koreense]|uniref:Transglycosylase SLT domain-containing protein n=1 Tax=Mycolicibacillus koreensis TaxID=1069220 RepID=A0A7I7SJM9_9MYCO|nr:lytic murein transglycosylase [Mycolicibacillus koreensis]MCV7250001.1 lytic murein transglycosylase [Mycolicibacillus koreensis]ODR10723.1 hypothetical protein BHQ15_04825 [Mycolicibacillus koreensis]OSC28931.1 hypothetical protein B8W67_17480 [Mycolicibacillus koreensis]BBY56730.1 hypothetical protein MKOR_39810 [Mycolicibacillus koreensis]